MSDALYIVCSNGHKRRKIATIVSSPRFDRASGEYVPDVAVILTDRKARDGMGDMRHHVQPPPSGYYSEDHNPEGDIGKVIPLLSDPHATHTFPCRSCKPVTVKHENVLRLYEGYRHAGRTSCELSELAATLRR